MKQEKITKDLERVKKDLRNISANSIYSHEKEDSNFESSFFYMLVPKVIFTTPS